MFRSQSNDIMKLRMVGNYLVFRRTLKYLADETDSRKRILGYTAVGFYSCMMAAVCVGWATHAYLESQRKVKSTSVSISFSDNKNDI